MARKHKHEEHLNHEAWAIPYGDLVTLLLALFVVMYAVSSINEGKYRVLADAMSAAFGGPPRSLKPVQVGEKQKGEAPESKIQSPKPSGVNLPERSSADRSAIVARGEAQAQRERKRLQQMAQEVERAMGDLISRELIVVKRTDQWIEIEIRTDILFGSGSAAVAPGAVPVLARLAEILRPFPNALRIEGHTDDLPIATTAFPSNWELSAARAASVVHLFMRQGVEPRRMTVAGFGEYRPAVADSSFDARNRNRRVVIVALAASVDELPDLGAIQPSAPAAAATASPAPLAAAPVVVVPSGTLAGLQDSP